MNLVLIVIILLVACISIEAAPGGADQPFSSPGDQPAPAPIPNSRSPPARR